MSLNEIKHSTLSELFFYDDAYVKKREMLDEIMWMNGMYTMDALRVVLSNAFASKGSTPAEYMKNSLLSEMREKNRVLTEEEKQEQIQILFGNLEMMQANFERTHGDKRNA